MSVQCWCECAGAAINQPVSCSIIWDHCANSGDWTLGFSNCDNDIPKRSRGLLLVLWKNSHRGSCISTWNWDACLLQRSSWIGWAVLRIFNINGKSVKVFCFSDNNEKVQVNICKCDLHRCQNWQSPLDTALMGTSSPPPDKEKTRGWEQSAVDRKHNCGYNAHIIFVILMTNGRLSSYWVTSWRQSRGSHAAASHVTVTQSHTQRQWSPQLRVPAVDTLKSPCLWLESCWGELNPVVWW